MLSLDSFLLLCLISLILQLVLDFHVLYSPVLPALGLASPNPLFLWLGLWNGRSMFSLSGMSGSQLSSDWEEGEPRRRTRGGNFSKSPAQKPQKNQGEGKRGLEMRTVWGKYRKTKVLILLYDTNRLATIWKGLFLYIYMRLYRGDLSYSQPLCERMSSITHPLSGDNCWRAPEVGALVPRAPYPLTRISTQRLIALSNKQLKSKFHPHISKHTSETCGVQLC